MEPNERTALLQTPGLSVFFAIICVVDVFGVFPVVALPKPILDCGYYGILVILGVCTVQIYTAILLGKCWNLAEEIQPHITRKSRYPYSALAEMTFGKCFSYYVTFLVDLTVFSGGIPNLIVAAQNLELFGIRISNGSFDLPFCYWIIVLGTALCPVLWLGSPKDMKVLCTISVLIVLLVYLLTCACLIFASTSESSPELNLQPNKELWKLIVTVYGIVAFQFDIHPTILTIQMDMTNKTKLPLAIVGGFLVSLFMFGTTTAIAALKYDSAMIQPSILETLPSSAPMHLAALLVAIQLCLTSAVSNSALYQHMENCLNISREFNHKRCILRTILTIFAVIIAESVPRFDLVMSLIGGGLMGPLVFVLPPLFYMKMLVLYRRHLERLEKQSFSNIALTRYYEVKFREEFGGSKWPQWLTKGLEKVWNRKIELTLCLVIVVASICATGLTTYLNINSAALSYVNFSKPCIYNVSNALLYL